MPAGRPTDYDPAMCDELLALGMEGASKAEMAHALGVARSTFTLWERDHPEFSAAVKDAVEASQGWWESKGREATFGKVPGFNATSFIFNMKNRFPNDWKDKQEVENNLGVTDSLADLLATVAEKGRRLGQDAD